MGSQLPVSESERLLLNFTEKGPFSSVKRIFYTNPQDCGVDRKMSGVMTSTNEQHILSDQFLFQRPNPV